MRVKLAAAGAAAAAIGAGAIALRDEDRRNRLDRQARIWRLTARRGFHWGTKKLRSRGATEEERARLDEQFAIKTAEDVAAVLGRMTGASLPAGPLPSVIADGIPT